MNCGGIIRYHDLPLRQLKNILNILMKHSKENPLWNIKKTV